jgi:riboflavin biosynthesis pyrimidine reductase
MKSAVMVGVTTAIASARMVGMETHVPRSAVEISMEGVESMEIAGTTNVNAIMVGGGAIAMKRLLTE